MTSILGSIGIITRPNGGYRLAYPTKKVAGKNLHINYPINRKFAHEIEKEVIKKFEEVMNQKNDRYNSFNAQQ